MVSVICHNPACGAKFEARRFSAKYHSDACRDVMARKRKKGADNQRPKKKNCKYCGAEFFISSKGRIPDFCLDSHRVMWHTNVRNAAMWFLTHKQGDEFRVMEKMLAEEFIDGLPNASLIELWGSWGYRFDGRQFVKISEQPMLL